MVRVLYPKEKPLPLYNGTLYERMEGKQLFDRWQGIGLTVYSR